jgi:hypothetical protein
MSGKDLNFVIAYGNTTRMVITKPEDKSMRYI